MRGVGTRRKSREAELSAVKFLLQTAVGPVEVPGLDRSQADADYPPDIPSKERRDPMGVFE